MSASVFRLDLFSFVVQIIRSKMPHWNINEKQFVRKFYFMNNFDRA